jgi:hypothetical protein
VLLASVRIDWVAIRLRSESVWLGNACLSCWRISRLRLGNMRRRIRKTVWMSWMALLRVWSSKWKWFHEWFQCRKARTPKGLFFKVKGYYLNQNGF